MSQTSNYIEFKYPGYWMLINYTITLTVNGAPFSFFKFTEPYTCRIPITQDIMYLEIAMPLSRKKTQLYLEPDKDYSLTLSYSRFSGKFSFSNPVRIN